MNRKKKKLTPQQRGWMTRRANEEKAEREARRLFRIRSEAAVRGWETRRREAEEKEREKRRRSRLRQKESDAKAAKEAERLRKWRKSYKKYLEFKIPKKKRKILETPSKKVLVCKVLFDADTEEPRVEHFWTEVRNLIGGSVGTMLARLDAVDGIVNAVFRLIEGEEFELMQRGTREQVFEWGELIPMQWESGLDLESFWSGFFQYGRSLLPNKAERKGQDYKAASLLVTRLEVCYEAGQVSSD